jgi:hypothetical protein
MHTTLPSAQPVLTSARDRSFFSAVAIANAFIIAVGFGYSTYARLQLGDLRFGGPTLTTLVRVHAAVSTAWTVLLIVQTRLIASNRIRLHRRLGIVGGMIAAALVGLGWVVAVRGIGRFAAAGEPDATMARRFFVLPVQELLVFAILVGAALWLRKRGDYHKRLMLLGTIALIPAATTRPFPPDSLLNAIAMFGLPEVILLAAFCLHDRRVLGRVHAATRWGGGLLLVTAVSRTLVAGTDTWLALAKVLVG